MEESADVRGPMSQAGSIAPPAGGFAFSTLGSPGASVSEIVAIACHAGCRGLELRSASGEAVHVDLAPAEVLQIREELADAGLTVLAVASYVGLCAPLGQDGSDEQLENLVAQLGLAGRIGAAGVRVFMRDESAPRSDGPSDGERLALRRLSAVTGLCAQLDVSVLIETHDTHSLGTRLFAFCAFLDVELPGHRCGVIWDSAHSWAQGEDPADTLRLLRAWLAYVQIKDVRSRVSPVPVMPGEGSYPIDELADALQSSGWGGWVSLEWERMWYPDLPSVVVALAETRIWAGRIIDGMETGKL